MTSLFPLAEFDTNDIAAGNAGASKGFRLRKMEVTQQQQSVRNALEDDLEDLMEEEPSMGDAPSDPLPSALEDGRASPASRESPGPESVAAPAPRPFRPSQAPIARRKPSQAQPAIPEEEGLEEVNDEEGGNPSGYEDGGNPSGFEVEGDEEWDNMDTGRSPGASTGAQPLRAPLPASFGADFVVDGDFGVDEDEEELARALEEGPEGEEGEEGPGDLPVDPLRETQPMVTQMDADSLKRDTQRILREQAEHDRIGRGYLAEAKPFTDALARLKERKERAAARTAKVVQAMLPEPVTARAVAKKVQERLLRSLPGDDGSDLDIEDAGEGDDEELPEIPYPGVKGAAAQAESESEEEEAEFNEDEEIIQTEAPDEEQDEDLKRRRRREDKRRKELGLPPGAPLPAPGAEGEGAGEGGMDDDDESEDRDWEAGSEVSDPDSGAEGEEGEEGDSDEGEEAEGEAEGEAVRGGDAEMGVEAAPGEAEGAEAVEGGAEPQDALRVMMDRAAAAAAAAPVAEFPRAAPMALIEDEAEKSDDEGHTDDEEDADVEGNLAELIGDAKDGKKDEKRRVELHKEWEVEEDKKQMKKVIDGVRTGWKSLLARAGQKRGVGEEDMGTDQDARKRRAAGFVEAEAQVRLGLQLDGDDDRSDDDDAGCVNRAKERRLLGSISCREVFRPASLDEASQGIMSLIHRAKDRKKDDSGHVGPASAGWQQPSRTATLQRPASVSHTHNSSSRLLLQDGAESQLSFLGRAVGQGSMAPAVGSKVATGGVNGTGRGFVFGSSLRGADDSQLGGAAAGDVSNQGGEGAKGSRAKDTPAIAPISLSAALAGKMGSNKAAPRGAAAATARPSLVGILKGGVGQEGKTDFGFMLGGVGANNSRRPGQMRAPFSR